MLIINEFLPHEACHLFNSPEFFRLHASQEGNYFQWLIKGKVLITLHLTEISEGAYRSPARGTFGGLSIAADVPPHELVEFMNSVQAHLRERGIRTLEILLAPMQHDSVVCSMQYFVLRSLAFRETQVDLNYAMAVDGQAFVQRINYANRKRLKKCHREGFEAKLAGADRLTEVYAVIAENRASKGYPMTMSEPQVREMQMAFPDALELFTCELSGQLVASAVCLRLRSDVLYVFYWGDLPGYAQSSPVVILAEAIYLSCQSRGIAVLDVGTSTVDMQMNLGLINFKRGLGFQESLKFRLEKRFEP